MKKMEMTLGRLGMISLADISIMVLVDSGHIADILMEIIICGPPRIFHSSD